MLSKLFGSKARVRILKNFLLHPDDKFYIRQLSRDLELQINSVRRELDNLEKFGLLRSSFDEDILEKKGEEEEYVLITSVTDIKKKRADKRKKEEASPVRQDKKYYTVDKEFVLFKEIKALIVKSQLLYEKDFIDKIETVGKIKLLILSGFFVNEDNSSVDIFVVGKIEKDKLLKIISELESDLGREINFCALDFKEYKYRRDMTDVFLYSILEGKNIVMINEIDK